MLSKQLKVLSVGLVTSGAILTAATANAGQPLLTLDGQPPIIIGHRGIPGLMPEETQASYEIAADLGTDALEEDLHLTNGLYPGRTTQSLA